MYSINTRSSFSFLYLKGKILMMGPLPRGSKRRRGETLSFSLFFSFSLFVSFSLLFKANNNFQSSCMSKTKHPHIIRHSYIQCLIRLKRINIHIYRTRRQPMVRRSRETTAYEDQFNDISVVHTHIYIYMESYQNNQW